MDDGRANSDSVFIFQNWALTIPDLRAHLRLLEKNRVFHCHSGHLTRTATAGTSWGGLSLRRVVVVQCRGWQMTMIIVRACRMPIRS